MAYPVTFLLFGATGDLAEKKLFPALFGLYEKKLLPLHFKIVGFARRPFTDEAFRELIKPGIIKIHGNALPEHIDTFLSKITYHQGQFDDLKAYISLINKLGEIDKELGACSHKIFHLSLSPFFYETVLKNLEASALNLSCTDGTGLTRILIEKPIGTDFITAQKINTLLNDIFKEDQIFRVDHYLMKNAFIDLLSLRFFIPELAAVWSGDCIKKISILLHEKGTIEGRGAFYDQVGALRDVGQNHILEMVALLLAERLPKGEERNKGEERANILSQLGLAAKQEVIRAQYKGYHNEEGVQPESKIETYFKLSLQSGLRKWKDTEIVIESGKALPESKVEVQIEFKNPVSLPSFKKKESIRIHSIKLHLQPKPRIELCGENNTDTSAIEYKDMLQETTAVFPDNYEKVYFDSLNNNQTYFVSKDETEASWKTVDPIIKHFNSQPLHTYESGNYPETSH